MTEKPIFDLNKTQDKEGETIITVEESINSQENQKTKKENIGIVPNQVEQRKKEIKQLRDLINDPQSAIFLSAAGFLNGNYILSLYNNFDGLDVSKRGSKKDASGARFYKGHELIKKIFIDSEIKGLFSVDYDELIGNGFNEEEAALICNFQIKSAEAIVRWEHGEEWNEKKVIGEIREKNPQLITWAEEYLGRIVEDSINNNSSGAEKAISIFKENYDYEGNGESPALLNGDTNTANSHAFGDQQGGIFSRWYDYKDTNLSSKYYNSILEKIFKDRVVIEIGPGGSWLTQAQLAREMGVGQYIGIDIDTYLEEHYNEETLKDWDEKITEKGGKIDQTFLLIDDPVNFLSKIEDHSVTITATNVFSEPMLKDRAYTEKLCALIAQKSLFEIYYFHSDPDMWMNRSERKKFISISFRNIALDRHDGMNVNGGSFYAFYPRKKEWEEKAESLKQEIYEQYRVISEKEDTAQGFGEINFY